MLNNLNNTLNCTCRNIMQNFSIMKKSGKYCQQNVIQWLIIIYETQFCDNAHYLCQSRSGCHITYLVKHVIVEWIKVISSVWSVPSHGLNQCSHILAWLFKNIRIWCKIEFKTIGKTVFHIISKMALVQPTISTPKYILLFFYYYYY